MRPYEALDWLLKEVDRGHITGIQAALDAGAPIDAKVTEFGKRYVEQNALQVAVRAGHVDAFKFLCSKGASLTPAGNPDLKLPYHANYCEGIEILQALVDEGVDLVNFRSYEGWTMLHYAASGGKNKDDASRIHFLLDLGMDPNVFEDHGYTALHQAAAAASANRCFELVKRGADVDFRNGNGKGWNPLGRAANYGCTKDAHEAVVCMLIALGSSTRGVTTHNYRSEEFLQRRALECAVLTCRTDVVAWCLEHVQDVTPADARKSLALAQQKFPEAEPLLRSWLAKDVAQQAAAAAWREMGVQP